MVYCLLSCLKCIATSLQALLSKGADPNAASSGTAAALVLAAKAGHSAVVRALKEHKGRC